MSSFLRSDSPATAKALSLVRLHHGLPSRSGEEIPRLEAPSGSGLARLWRRGARQNHLAASRRRVALDRIPAERCPAILELSGGSNFVILLERDSGSADAYRVQFPDSREAVVRGERLRELYDGTCVFLSPASSGWAGWIRRLRRGFAARP